MEAFMSFGRKHEKGSSIPPPIICEDPSSDDTKCKEISLKRKRVNKALATFRDLSHKLFCEYKSSLQLGNLQARTKALLEAAMLMKKKHQWENTKKQVGHVAGVEVGDRFQYRTELIIIGLHHQFSGGIDYMGKGENSLATSIVVTHRYDNVMKSGGSLVYVGQGGNPNVRGNVLPHDQKLEGGNLALKNSMDARSPVRVILKVSRKSDGLEEQWSNSSSTSNCSYVYDGLYLVDNMFQERGEFGKLVFKFILNKISDQPTCVTPQDVDMEGGLACLPWRKRQRSKGHVVQKDVVRMNDVSGGKERCPIRVVTPMSCVQMPPPFDYIVNMAYPEKFKFNQPILSGCDCAYNTCGDCQQCVCIVMNGGAMPYDCNKRLASHMISSPCFIYECGPSCKCSPSCINRVSQCGIQFQLEIFKTEMKGWGVRTRSFIPAGSFVCELIGEVHYNRRAAGSRLDVDNDSDYIFDIGADKGFNIDATRCGNVGRFISHSCSPNLCVKDVMYDHNDESLPHKMLFAVRDIAACRELSYDYNCCKGNVKFRINNCHCGSGECKGQIYI